MGDVRAMTSTDRITVTTPMIPRLGPGVGVKSDVVFMVDPVPLVRGNVLLHPTTLGVPMGTTSGGAGKGTITVVHECSATVLTV